MSKKIHHGHNYGRKNLITDKNTDYLFDYFMNEDKFNEQLKGQWDEELAKRLENHELKLDSRIITEKQPNQPVQADFSTDEPKELPTVSPYSDERNEPNVDFNEESENEYVNQNASIRSPYASKINAVPPPRNQMHQIPENPRKEIISERPLLGEKLVEDVQKYVETPEERRARAREEYSKLQDLVQKYDVTLTRSFSINDDPDEMRAEYDMHKEKRNKNNQVKFYKQILLNIVCGAEFLNERYNPFEFKLKDWSKQIASDMDDYTEVLEEIYEKYKDRGGKMAPEIRLLFMIIFSGITFHLSQTLFGAGGLGDTIQNNPNILNKLLGGLMKGGVTPPNDAEPTEAKEAPPATANLLAALRNHKQNKNSEVKTEASTNANTDGTTEVSSHVSKLDAINKDREMKLLEDQRLFFENQLRQRDEMYRAQLEELKNRSNNVEPMNIKNTQQQISEREYSPKNQVLSDISKKPRFHENPLIKGDNLNMADNIFDSEIKESPNVKSKLAKSTTKNKINFDELLDSLGGTTDMDIDDVIETSSKKRNAKINTTSKPVSSIRKPNNSVTRSVTRSVNKKKINSSETSASKQRGNVIKL